MQAIKIKKEIIETKNPQQSMFQLCPHLPFHWLSSRFINTKSYHIFPSTVLLQGSFFFFFSMAHLLSFCELPPKHALSLKRGKTDAAASPSCWVIFFASVLATPQSELKDLWEDFKLIAQTKKSLDAWRPEGCLQMFSSSWNRKWSDGKSHHHLPL